MHSHDSNQAQHHFENWHKIDDFSSSTDFLLQNQKGSLGLLQAQLGFFFGDLKGLCKLNCDSTSDSRQQHEACCLLVASGRVAQHSTCCSFGSFQALLVHHRYRNSLACHDLPFSQAQQSKQHASKTTYWALFSFFERSPRSATTLKIWKAYRRFQGQVNLSHTRHLQPRRT